MLSLSALKRQLTYILFAGTLIPGWGCDLRKADDIAQELKERMRGRGDTEQMKLSEQAKAKAIEIDAKVDLILKHFDVTPGNMEIEREVETLEEETQQFDSTSYH